MDTLRTEESSTEHQRTRCDFVPCLCSFLKWPLVWSEELLRIFAIMRDLLKNWRACQRWMWPNILTPINGASSKGTYFEERSSRWFSHHARSLWELKALQKRNEPSSSSICQRSFFKKKVIFEKGALENIFSFHDLQKIEGSTKGERYLIFQHLPASHPRKEQSWFLFHLSSSKNWN